MNKKQLLEKLSQTYCRVGISKIHGVGVIAIRDIPKGRNPFPGVEKQEYIKISKSEMDNLNIEIKKMIADFFVSERSDTYIPICGLDGIDISFFMNHQQDPNVTVDEKGEMFTTLREIKRGEELTCNYAISYGETEII